MIFHRKCVKTQPIASAKHKFQRLILNPASKKSFDFLAELQIIAKNAFLLAPKANTEQVGNAKMASPGDVIDSGRLGKWHMKKYVT